MKAVPFHPPPGRPMMGGILPPGLNFAGGGLMGGDFRQVGGGDFLAKALDPEGPPPQHRKPCRAGTQMSHVPCRCIIAYVDPWKMLMRNNFSFHVYAQKSLFILVKMAWQLGSRKKILGKYLNGMKRPKCNNICFRLGPTIKIFESLYTHSCQR